MKRDLSLIRSMLLKIESLPPEYTEITYKDFSDLCNSRDVIELHMRLLADANFVELIDERRTMSTVCIITRMTFAGYDYLDAIRDKSVWNAIQAEMLKVGGSTAIEVVKALGIQFLSQKLGILPQQ